MVKSKNYFELCTADIQFAFTILQRLRPKTDFAYAFLLDLIKASSVKDEFIKKYINEQDRDSDFYAKFENKYNDDPAIKDFCIKKDTLRFANQPLSIKTLKEYFEKYYLTGADTGLFVKRLIEYFKGINVEKKIDECIRILNMLKFPENADKKRIIPVYSSILDNIFSLEYEKIFELREKREWIDKIREIYNFIKDAGNSLKQETEELVVITLCGQILIKYGFKENDKNLISFFSDKQEEANKLSAKLNVINSQKNIDVFIDYYFQPVINILIFGATLGKQFNYDNVLEKVFGKIIEKGDIEIITENIIYGVKKSKANPIAFILYIFRKLLMPPQNPLDQRLGDIAKNYFEQLSSGERKKTFSDLLAKAEEAEVRQFESYFEEFNKEHKSTFFGFLKSKK
jgi:hypothetical protein